MGGAENPVEWLGRNGIWSEGPYITAALDHAIEHLTIPCRKLVSTSGLPWYSQLLP